LPASGLLLAAQIRYQVRLLLANGRTVAICIGLPVILLVTSGISHGHASAAAVAGPATFGLTLAAWNAGGVRLVAAREAGVLKRWRATRSPGGAISSAGSLPPWPSARSPARSPWRSASASTTSSHRWRRPRHTPRLRPRRRRLGCIGYRADQRHSHRRSRQCHPHPDLLPVLIVSGLLGSISEPHWLTTLASYLPVRPLADAVTSALRHATGTPLFPCTTS